MASFMLSNEAFFFCHILIVIAFLMLAYRLGKEALIAFVAIGGVLANLFVTKQISFFSLNITCSDVFIVQAILALNLLQEFYGKQQAKKAANITFFCMIFFAVMSQIHILYAPSAFDQMHSSFEKVLSFSPRIVTASIAVFVLVQRIDIVLFSSFRALFQGKYLPLRMMLSLIITQLLDTVLFGFIGLYGLVHSLFDIILLSFVIKLIVIFTATPFTLFIKRFKKDVTHAL